MASNQAVADLHKMAYACDQRILRASNNRRRIQGELNQTFSQCIEMPLPKGKFGTLYIHSNYEDICIFDTTSGTDGQGLYIDAAINMSNIVFEIIRDESDFYIRDCVMSCGRRLDHISFYERLAIAQEILHRNYKGTPSGVHTDQVGPHKHMWYEMGRYRISTLPVHMVGTIQPPKMSMALMGQRDLYIDQ